MSESKKETALQLIDLARCLLHDLEEAEGVADDELEALIDYHYKSTADKLGGYHYAIKGIKSRVAALKTEAKLITERAKTLQNQIPKLTDKALQLLEAHNDLHGESKVKGATYTAWLAKTTKMQAPDDVNDWPMQFCTTKIEPDSTKAKQALRNGETLEGFELVQSVGIRFR